MSARLQEFYEDIAHFVQQDQHTTLVVSVDDPETVYLYQAITALDSANRDHIWVLFPQIFASPGAYVTAMIASLEEQLTSVRKTLAEHNKVISNLPDACHDLGLSPQERFRTAVSYTRDLVPKDTGQNLVWCMVPMEVNDPEGYRDFVSSWIPSEPTGWTNRLRLIIRERRTPQPLSQLLGVQKNKQTLLYQPDLTPGALIDTVVQQVSDPNRPMPARMEGLFELAMLDLAYQRYEQAIEKFWILHDYYQSTHDLAMECLCLGSLGTVAERQNAISTAKEKYLQALSVAGDAQSLPLILQYSQSVGQLCFRSSEWTEAEGYLRIAAKIAEQMQNPFVLADLQEWIGQCCGQQQKWGDAAKEWIKGVELCRTSSYDQRRVAILERLVQLFTETHRTEELERYQTELRSLSRQGAQR